MSLDYTHTHLSSPSGSSPYTVSAVMPSNQHTTFYVQITPSGSSAILYLNLTIGNYSDNYFWVSNSGSADCDIILSIVDESSVAISPIHPPKDGITVASDGICEIGFIRNSDGVFVTRFDGLQRV